MSNPVRAMQDFWRKRKVAQALYDNLKKHGRPGGIDVSRLDSEGAAALMWLLAHNHDITVVKNSKNLTLMFKQDVDRIFSADVAKAMERAGVTANPGEDLIRHG